MWFAVLGHLAARRADGNDVPIPGPARRQVLAALLCRPGAIVATSTLVEDLWGSTPPRSAVNSLRSHVVRLRTALAQGGDDSILVTVGDGYRLNVTAEDVDAGRFEALAEEAARTSDAKAAIEHYDQALGLWRDEPYVEFGDAPFAVLERIRLTELRAAARERRTDLALEIGAANELVGDLEQRVHAEPYRERGWEQLALALYRAGRQADALSACRRARRVLLDDLGVDPGPALQTLEQRLLHQDPQLLAPAPRPVATLAVRDRCPYLGLAGYEEQDAALFVGRERLTSVLAGRLADQSVVVVTGASGVGKSSLVRAGLVPALRSGALPGSSAWRIDVRTPGISVLGEEQRRPELLVLDQAEELFTGMDPAEREDLVHRIARFLDDEQGRLVLVVRSDVYGRLADVPSLARYAEKAAVLVGGMRADELRRALLEPAARTGLRLEDELVETVLDDVAGQPEPLPLLSEAMVRTWERREGDLLTLDGYERAGELSGALEAAAEECWAHFDEDDQRAARQLLMRMAAYGDTGWFRRHLTYEEAARQAPQRVLQTLADARLITIGRDRVEVSHESLLTRWPRLAGWLAERATAAELLGHLEAAERAWRAAGCQDGDLYRGARLQEALDRRAEHPEDFSAAESEFLDASQHLVTRELTLARQQAAREAAGRRRLRGVAIALAVALVLAGLAAGIAVSERGTADRQARRAEQAALTADARKVAAEALTAPDLRTSLLLAAAAYRMQDSVDTRSGLLSAIERFGAPLYRIPTDDRLQWIGVNRQGTRVWAMDNLRTVRVFDARTRTEVGKFTARADHVVTMSPDSRLLIAVGPADFTDTDGATRAIAQDATTGDVRAILRVPALGQGTGTRSAAFTGDGRWLAIIEAAPTAPDTPLGLVAVFDANHLNAAPRVLHFRTPVVGVAGAPDRFAVRTAGGTIALIDPVTLRTVAAVNRAQLGIRARELQGIPDLAMSPDARYLAAGTDTRVQILDTLHLSAASIVTESFSSPETAMSFAPAGDLLAVGTGSGEADLIHLPDGTLAARESANTGQIMSVAWSGHTKQDEMLFAGGLDSQIVAYAPRQASRQLTVTGPGEPGTDYLRPAGRDVLGIQPDEGIVPESRINLWVANRGSRTARTIPLRMPDNTAIASLSADSADRRVLLTIQDMSGPITCRLFDVATGRVLGEFLPKTGENPHFSYEGVISRDGRTAVVSVGRRELATYALPSGKLLATTTVTLAGPARDRTWASPLAFAPNGGLLVWGFNPKRNDALPPPSPNTLHVRAEEQPQYQQYDMVDLATGRMHGSVLLGPEDIYGVPAWSPDGHWLAIGTDAGTLTLLDAATLRPVADRVSTGATSADTVAYSPDARTIVTAGFDGSLRFWDAATGRSIGPTITVGDGRAYAWFDQHGNVFGYVLNADGTSQHRFTYPGRPSEWLATACATAGSDLTRDEWARYVSDRPYSRTCP